VTSPRVRCEVRERVAHVELCRPQVLNAIDAATCVELVTLIDTLEAAGDVGVMVVSGAGPRAFSSGADLKHMRTLQGAELRRFIELTWRTFDRIACSPLPSIAALHGHVLGAGCELALACDLRIADATARIALPEMTLGSVPGSGAVQRLPSLIGRARALELMLLGDSIDATAAARSGLVNCSVAAGQALASAFDWARRIAALQPASVRYLKAALAADDPRILAPALHGLVSDLCHRDPAYAVTTARFGNA
jgi:enoyl-CoA hydratase/carnithine racemase